MLMQRLRDDTAELHENVEQSLNPAERFRTRENYIALLQILYPFYGTIEAIMAKLDWGSIGFDFDARCKTRLLAGDLHALGRPVEGPAPQAVECSVLIDLASGFGALYVLEGAALGGRILRKILKANLGIDDSTGGSFYDGYGDATQRRWQEFGTAVDGYCDGFQQRADSAVAAATATFSAMGRLLSAPPLASD